MTGAVMWDLDGTLVASEDCHWRAWRDTAAIEGIALTYQQFLESFGKKNDLILRGWLGDDATIERIARISDAKEEEYRRLARTEGLRPLPGAAEWVEALHRAGWTQAIASSAPRANVDVVMDAIGFAPFMQAIVAAEDVSRSKPDPECFLTASVRLGVPPDRCIVVEDAAAGIAAARAAGMKCIGVSRHVSLTGADVFVRDLTQLPPDEFERLMARV
jgi:beta-phosphoglucomutase